MTLGVPEPADPSKLRASTADREAVASVLNQAMSEGRITVPELEERLGIVYAAKTIGELEPVTRDLPAWRTGLPVTADSVVAGSPPARIGGTPTSTAAVAILSSTERTGEWVVPPKFTAVTVMGSIELDLTKAQLAYREVTITAVALMGSIDVIVPDDIAVVVDGIPIMGTFDRGPDVASRTPSAPMIRINGVSFFGAVTVHRPKDKRLSLEKR